MLTVNTQKLLNKRGLCDQPQARRRLINNLSKRGINARVLQAIAVIPRHAFVPAHLISQAYKDCYLFTDKTVLSQPYFVALMTQYLDLNCRKKVLEIGTGTGYHTAILALLSGHVFTIERIPELVKESAETFAALGLCNISQRLGDGFFGWPEAAPFDAILVTAAPSTIPQTLVQQLHPQHGCMVIPVGPQGRWQRLYVVQRRGQEVYKIDLGPVCFVPFVPSSPWRAGFSNHLLCISDGPYVARECMPNTTRGL